MRMTHFVGTLLSVASLFAPSAMAAEDPDVTDDCSEIAQLMSNDDFAALDAMAARFRTGELNAAGESRLGRLYICMSRAIGTARQEVDAWNHWSAWAARWVQHAPKSPAAHLMTARIPLNLAWSYRGNGYANTVNAEDGAQFHEYNAVSQAYLQSHEGVASGDPFWHEMSVLIALRESADDEELLKLVDRAAKAFPDYEPLHFIAMQHFTPAWGGQRTEDGSLRAALDGQCPQEEAGHALRAAVLVGHRVLGRSLPRGDARLATDAPGPGRNCAALPDDRQPRDHYPLRLLGARRRRPGPVESPVVEPQRFQRGGHCRLERAKQGRLPGA